MTKLPKYSVLMSLYIKEKSEYLRLAIDSMLNQTIVPDEIVIVEDGPLTDSLYAVLDEYKAKHREDFLYMVSLPTEEKRKYLLKHFNIQ